MAYEAPTKLQIKKTPLSDSLQIIHEEQGESFQKEVSTRDTRKAKKVSEVKRRNTLVRVEDINSMMK